jgi:2-polyprenyl-3-methyl-5-hydroxy-6-metoxy-1,4-benzoquinol methylase
MHGSTLDYYNENAEKLAELYETADMSEVHSLLLRFLPQRASVMEIGCGSGRDAAFLIANGYDVTAVEASAQMMEVAQRLHPELAGRITLASVPLRDSDSLLSRQFGAVVCIGTILHVPDQYLFEFASQRRDLVSQEGIFFLSGSIRILLAQATRDEHSRLIIERVPEEIQLLFERLGFQLLTRTQNDDAHGRPAKWFSLVFSDNYTCASFGE